jgi:hypothetical protein
MFCITMTLRLQFHPWELSIARGGLVDASACADSALLAWVKAPDEQSLVCETRLLPPNMQTRSDGWCCFSVVGPLDFSLTGILAGIATVLANAGISLFAISTFDTDYVLIKQESVAGAKRALATHYEMLA